jgi:hypothetical protein
VGERTKSPDGGESVRTVDATVCAQGEFTDEGTQTHFEIGKHVAYVKSESSGKRKTGIVHRLFVDGAEVDKANVLA